jgi:hypothetical protein
MEGKKQKGSKGKSANFSGYYNSLICRCFTSSAFILPVKRSRGDLVSVYAREAEKGRHRCKEGAVPVNR